MFVPHRSRTDPKTSSTPDLDDEEGSIIDDDVDVVVDVDAMPAQKPHFLDDAMPPPDMVEQFDKVLTFGGAAKSEMRTSTGEQLKMDKKYERDGEVSDYELAASGYTKKEFTQDDNTLHLASGGGGTGKSAFSKPKHFLDENPIPPDYMLVSAEHEMRREHRSLDRNFERQGQQHQDGEPFTPSPLMMMSGQLRNSGRKSSLDRGSGSGSSSSARTSRERNKESYHASYTLSRFLDSDGFSAGSLPPQRVPKGAAWAGSFDSRYGSLPMVHDGSSLAAGGDLDVDVDRLGPKVECVYSLLSMLGSNDSTEMSKKFLELSRSPETCVALRRAGCIPLLVQMMHSDGEESVRKCAGLALHNVVHSHPDEKAARREAKVLRLLEQIMDYCNFLKTLLQSGGEAIADDSERHPLAAISSLMKVSFDEEHRHAMCELGALQAIPNLVHLDHAVHGPKPEDQCCNSLRRYALMALTNLTFGDENNKALLCSQKLFMEALVAQLDSAPDDLLQVTASVLRNLSWRADSNMKAVLNEIGTVTALAHAAMKNKSENTLKAILSALWNLSAHCSTNKAEFCAVDGALAFLVDMLTYEGPSKTLKIIENAGGILRNVSSHIAVREHYRQILRERNCLSILLQQLKSESLTVVSNSCGTLWNLSARCPEDQKFLWDNGAVPMLRSLIHSKHAMISEGSSSALKNLLNFRPAIQSQNQLDPIARSMGLRQLPTLNARKQKALEQELDGKQHAETCDNLDMGAVGVTKEEQQQPNYSSTLQTHAHRQRYPPLGSALPPSAATRLTRSAMLTKSESRDSVFSAKSDTAYENLIRSHSASDANRKVITQKIPYAALRLENDVESTEIEQPIDYSAKYSENAAKVEIGDREDAIGAVAEDSDATGGATDNAPNYATYQETDLDQPTDFSLRYAEHQIELDVDVTLPEARTGVRPTTNGAAVQAVPPVVGGGSEILLILEDTVKCYQTEDTPYVISNAASVTDLRQAPNKADNPPIEKATADKPKKYQRITQAHSTVSTANNATIYGSGSYTPEKPINYCEEGTPGYFSRYESLSSLDESPPAQSGKCANNDKKSSTTATTTDETLSTAVTNDDAKVLAKSAANLTNDHSNITIAELPKLTPASSDAAVSMNMINSAQETPLMFSRHSSMDSLVEEGEEEIGVCDDKSSVVSDFSRLASGVISPSEIPDSPTQSVPQSPRRNSNAGQFPSGTSPLAPRSSTGSGAGVGMRNVGQVADARRPLRSVFEDDLNTFHVENTPAQFSCATSLSNLSIMDDENSLPPSRQQERELDEEPLQPNIISEGEDEESGTNNDDLLLASCINMGMNRVTASASLSKAKRSAKNANNTGLGADAQLLTDEPKHYHTEDTPALLSKVGSNTNLSAISICSSSNKEQLDVEVYSEVVAIHSQVKNNNNNNNEGNRQSLNLSDDVSSNASESGATGQSFDILQQCIRVGMKKPAATGPDKENLNANRQNAEFKVMAGNDAIAMLRRGGNNLPPYLPVKDEMSKYLVEDSPCNFSVVSGLSNLTVGSSLVGPAVQLQGCNASVSPTPAATDENAQQLKDRNFVHEEDARVEQQWHDDSLSSLSIDSEDDTNLLSQAIAAGCNRPKSNLGFSSTTTSNKRTSLSASQPIPINAATSTSSLNSSATSRQYQRNHHASAAAVASARHQNGNDSYSSVDSSDSNDNQSKSLFELCIRTGMHKTRDAANNRRQQLMGHRGRSGGNMSSATQSNPNLKQFDSLPTQLAQQRPMVATTTAVSGAVMNRHVRDRERKDEKLLLECINTGISKKIGSTSASHSRSTTMTRPREPLSVPIHAASPASNINSNINVANAVPKNGQATSAAASVPCLPNADITSPSAPNTAAPDVRTNININTNTNNSSGTNITPNQSINSNSSIHCIEKHPAAANQPSCVDITDVLRDQVKVTEEDSDAGRQNHANGQDLIANGTGCREDSDELEQDEQEPSINSSSASASLEHTSSDDSNESFIMETTVSLETQHRPATAVTTADKHKNPDLMLKSVERLTLEFVSSAEQLRTNGSSGGEMNESNRVLGSISIGGSNSNNTWNEDTCPNDDVSFPSVSVTAPVVASLNYDDDDDDDDDNDLEQATEADHKDLHDFAEITPTNEEQPQPSMGFDTDEMYTCVNTTQPSSLETETEADTLVSDDHQTSGNFLNLSDLLADRDSSNSSGINFKLGGAVQSAAVSMANRQLMYGNNANGAGAGPMSNSAIIAFEARALAENLQHHGDEHEELTFSMNSLDLDNIRPPSGMESLNASGYYHDPPHGFHSLGAQSNSMQQQYRSNVPQSPQLSTKSPKFPRKSLPFGLMAKRALGHLPGHLGGSAESVNSSCNLLDNIKPPSLMDELLDSMISVASIQSEVADCESSLATTVSAGSNYETAAGGGNNDFDDNTVTLQSCYDTIPHDNDYQQEDDGDEGSLRSGTPLPTDDGDFSSAESTPHKSGGSTPLGGRRTLTPKQKRQVAKDRYRTYTISTGVNVLSEEERRQMEEAEAAMADETMQIEIIETTAVTTSGSSIGQRRRSDAQRYRTQTIVYPVKAPTQKSNEEVLSNDEQGPCSLTSTDDCLSDDASSIRAMTQRFKFITAPLPTSETNGVKLQAKAIETISEALKSLKTGEEDYTSMEFDQNSETESCHGHDELYGTANGTVIGSDESDDSEEEEAAAGTSPARARIMKPNIVPVDKNAEEQAKKIRGRKKPAYVSPYSMQFQRSNPPQTRIATSKLLTPISNATHLRKPTVKSHSIPELPPAPATLERQGTFVQDEPTIATEQVPVVGLEPTNGAAKSGTSPAKSNSSPQRNSKLPTKRPATAKTSPVAQSAATRKIPTTVKATTTPTAATRKGIPSATAPQRSNSNATIRVSSNAARIAVLSARVSTTTPPSRSNSNLNCNAVASAKATKSAAAKISQAQSRIASIWKRVDEVKNKQQPKGKTSPKAASSNLKTQSTRSSTTLNAQKANQGGQAPSSQMQPKQQLVRSSTFDSTPVTGAELPTIHPATPAKGKIAIPVVGVKGKLRK